MDANKQQDKRERFKRLATQRTNIILNRLKVLGNCSNRSAYEYTSEEVDKIFSEIEKRVKEIKSKFHPLKIREFKL
jgi:CHASE1-domain containing sensor protein